MAISFTLPSGLIGKFAIVKLWPGIKTAEDECIARLKIAASGLGIECIEIHADGRLLEDPKKTITKNDVDFVLHLHYDTPKLYDAFSFVALWNPTQFYHEWGYARTSRNLLTHDDFISCSSPAADDHVARLIRKVATHLPPLFNLYHSVSDVVHLPSLGDGKLFYAGINWDALRGGISRHQELLQRLDKSGNLRIFGPSIFQGVKVWKGYDSYVREIPFDGISMIDEISRAGIALVLSSQAHKDSELMSNRLFESVAAGALVICDENNFAKKFFGDCLLYIDTRDSVEDVFNAIERHLAWCKKNPEKALAMVARSQEIFREKFALKKNLSDLYQGLTARKLELQAKQCPVDNPQIKVALYFLMPEYSEKVLNAHIESAVSQEYVNFSPILVVDKADANKHRSSILKAIEQSSAKIDVIELDFNTYGTNSKIKVRRKVGEALAEILALRIPADAVVFVAPNEVLFSNHLHVLAGSLARNPSTNCVASAVIYKHTNLPIHQVHERIDFIKLDHVYSIGYARFIFRVSAISKDLNIALPYLDRKAMAVLVGDNIFIQEIPSTVVVDVVDNFPVGSWDEGQENNLIASFCPQTFNIATGHEIIVPNLADPSVISNAIKLTRRLSWNWIRSQVNALQRDGFSVRFKVLKSKLKTRHV